MPLDYRRFNGPEDSIPYQRYTKGYVKSYSDLEKELQNKDGFRIDGRKPEEGRASYARTGVISQAKGSAYIELKKTKVICSVFDPREIPHQNEFSQDGQLFCELKFASFSCKRQRRMPAPDAEEKALSVALRQALEPAVCRYMFPNYQVDIFVYVLENDGACLAAAINAAGLALADAAVPMFDLITASSVAVINNVIYIDPVEAEEFVAMTSPDEEVNHGVITMSTLSELKQVSHFAQIGNMDVDCVNKVINILEKQCQDYVPYIQQVLVSNVIKGFKLKKQLDEEEMEREERMKLKVEGLKKKLYEE